MRPSRVGRGGGRNGMRWTILKIQIIFINEFYKEEGIAGFTSFNRNCSKIFSIISLFLEHISFNIYSELSFYCHAVISVPAMALSNFKVVVPMVMMPEYSTNSCDRFLREFFYFLRISFLVLLFVSPVTILFWYAVFSV